MRKYCEMISFPLSKKTTKCGTGKSLCAIIGNKLNCVIAGRPETHTHLDIFRPTGLPNMSGTVFPVFLIYDILKIICFIFPFPTFV